MPTRLAVVFLALGCVAASAVGGFFAGRQGTAEEPAATSQAATLPVSETMPPPDAAAQTEITETTKGGTEPRAGSTSPESTPRPAPRSSARPSSEVPARTSPNAASAPPAARPAPPVVVHEPSPAPAPIVASPPVLTSAPPPPALPQPVALNDAIELRVEPEPIEPAHVELVVAADSVIGLRITDTISTETAQIEDNVDARIVRDVRVGGTVAIPAGARARGSVTVVERGGRFKDRARIGIRFHTLILSDGTELPVSTETVFRLGEAPGDQSATKIGGGAVLGALIGAIIGGGKGAAIGAASGAGGGTAAVMASDVSEAAFPAGTEVTARLLGPVSVVTEP